MADTTAEGVEAPAPGGVPITVNGKEVLADEGELIIDAAERHGIYIPRFCYHPRMEPVGMCRMCLAEVDTGRGPALQPTCMLECTPGMKVDTESEATKKAQDGVLEFLLINHPLDCPVCDKGGECPLQDQTVAYGPGESRFIEEKRHKEKPIAISDLVYLDRERCILCDRCTRFAKDVAGDPLIHFIHRGNNTEVNTFPDHPFASYFSGNTVQICPVGALTASSYRFRARPWDLEASESTCTTCAVGCRVAVESSRNEVLRYSGVDSDPVNWGWLCDKGRFDFQAYNSEHRLRDPLLKGASGEFQVVRWTEALRRAAAMVQEALDAGGPGAVAVLGGARLTNESAYAWAKLAKGVIGTDHVDCQLADGLPPDAVLGLPKATIDDACAPGGTVILLGPDLKEELPILYLRLRHAVTRDRVQLIEITPVPGSCSSLATVSLHPRPGESHAAVRALLHGIPQGYDGGGVDPAALERARNLLGQGRPVTVVLGRQSVAEAADWVVDGAAALLDGVPGVRFLTAVRRGNVHGALDMGLAPGLLPGRVRLGDGGEWFGQVWPQVPSTPGLDATGILQAAAAGQIHTLVLLGADPLGDFPDHQLATKALAAVRNVVAVDTFVNESVQHAGVVLAAAAFGEVEGTTTNLEGRVTVLNQQVTPPGTARADWMIAAELARLLGSDLQVESADDLWSEIEQLAPAHRGLTRDVLFAVASADGVVVPMPGPEDDESASAELDDGPAAVETPSDVAGDGDEADEGGDADEPEAPVDRPAPLVFVAGDPLEPPPVDAYSLRLFASRRLYDLGTLVQTTPALAGLPGGTVLRVNPYDFDRLGVAEGSTVRIKTPAASFDIEIHTDAGVPRGAAAVAVNQPGVAVTDLIDAGQRVTDIRIETGSSS
ncbi:MAG: NADH-quinone oxidoreductase subunit NuoG [Acidimicrobiales bacterium]